MAKRKDPEVGQDVQRKYLQGGVYKRNIIEKQGKGRSERTKLSSSYVAVPPPEGWPGGHPEDNGYRPGKGR